MADDFRAQIIGEIDLTQVEQKLTELKNKKINLDIEVGDPAKKLSESISRGLKKTKLEIPDLTKQITDNFNITSPAAISKIRKQMEQLGVEMTLSLDNGKVNGSKLTAGFDAAFDGMAETIARNSGAIKSQMTDFYKSFYDDYKNMKVYISDDMKSALGSAYDDIAQSGRITRDASKGVDLNANWDEMANLHPEVLSGQLANAQDQVIAFINAMKAAKQELKSALNFDDLDVSLQNEISNDAFAQVADTTRALKQSLENNIQTAAGELKSEFIVDITINSGKLVSDIQAAISQATSAANNPVQIPVDIKIDLADIQSKIQAAFATVSGSNVNINVDIDKTDIENSIRAAVSGVDFPLDFKVDPDDLRDKIRQAVAGLNDLEVDVNVNVDTLQNSIRQTVGNTDIDGLDLVLNSMSQINRSGQQGEDIFSAFGGTLREAFSTFTLANLLEDAIYKVIEAGKEAVSTVKELDDAALDLQMATGASKSEAYQMISDYNSLGQELGALTTEVSSSADAWLRQGKTAEEAEQLIKESMTLSKVAQLDAADSTDYLTSAMKGYKVATEDVSQITDKLTAIDLVSATDAGGLAEAMSRVANSANIAGISMDRLLAILAATGEVTQQSMSTIGTAYKTVFARMGDVKAGELSSIGDDGTIEDISDVEISLNAVGIKLRDSNQEFRNFQTVLDDVAAAWDSYSSVQQRAIAKAFAGTRQQENFLVMMENYDKVLEYDSVAANSTGTAAEKFGYYLDSLEAKTKALQASLEALASKTLSSEVYSAFLGTSKQMVDFATKTDLVKTALVGVGAAGATFGITRLSTLISNTAAQISELGGGLTGLWGILAAHPVIAVTAAVTAGAAAWNMYHNAVQEQVDTAKKAGSSWKESESAFQSQIERVRELREELASGTLTEEEAYSAKSELFSIQQQLTESYGSQAAGIDLVNGSLETQIGLIEQLSKAEADRFLNENQAGINKAVKEMEKERKISLGEVNLGSEEGRKVQEIADQYQKDIEQNFNPATGILTLDFVGDATTAETTLNDFMTKLRNASEGYQDNDEYWFENVFNAASDGLENVNEVLEEYQELYNQAQNAQMVADEKMFGLPNEKAQTAAKWLNDYSEAVENYNNALLLGNTDKISDAAAEFGDIDTAIQTLLQDTDMSEYADQFEDVRNQLNETAITNKKFLDALAGDELSENGKKVKKYADILKDLDLDDIDFMTGFGTEESVEGKNAIIGLAAAAQKMGYISDTSEESLRSLADALIQAGIISGETTAPAINETASAFDNMANSSKDLRTVLSTVDEALSAQSTGKSIDYDVFNAEELVEYRSALEYVNGSLQLNEEKVKALTRAKVEEQTAANDATKAQLQQKYLENAADIDTLRDKLLGLDDSSDEYASTLMQIQGLQNDNSSIATQCSQLDVLNANLRESIGLYQEWQNAQNAPESGDMFDDTLTALQLINETLNDQDSDSYGRVGREDYQTSLGLVIPDTVDAEDTAAVNSYLDSIASLFTYDEDGEKNGLNIAEFCRQSMEQGLMVLDEESQSYQIAGQTTMEDFAKGLNLSMPLVRAMFGEMEEFGGEFDWNDEIFNSFGDGIYSCEQQAEILQSKLDELNENKAMGLEVDDSEIEETQSKLDEVIAKKKELEEKSVANIEANISIDNQIEQAKQDVDGWKTALEADPTNIEIQANYEQAQQHLDSLLQEKSELQEPTTVEITAAVADIDSKISDAQTQLDNLKNKEYCATYSISDEVASQKISELQSQIDTLNQKKAEIQTYAETSTAMDNLNALENKDIGDKDFTVSVVDNATSVLDSINNTTLNDKEFTITTKRVTVNETQNTSSGGNTSGTGGTIGLNGTAHAGGSWGTRQNGKTLVGELGREIMVNPKTGMWHTVGDNGAEFVDVPKGSIIFNHLQTEELLKNRFVAGRATALASGTAFASGNAMVGGGITVENASKSVNNTHHDYGNTGDKKKDSSGDTKIIKDTTKTVKKTIQAFDWVAVKLQYFADKTKKIADTITDYVSYTFSNSQLNKQIKAVQREQTANKNGYNTYMAKADSVAEKYKYYTDKGQTINVKIPEEYIKKVQEGKYKIEDMDTSTDEKKALAEAVQSYQDYYEKAKQCAETTRELAQTEKELRVQRLENIAANYDGKVQRTQSKISNIQSSIEVDQATGKKIGTRYTAKTNADNKAALKKERKEIQSQIEQSQYEEANLRVQKNNLKVQLKTTKDKNEKKEIQAQIVDVDNKLKNNKADQNTLNTKLINTPDVYQEYKDNRGKLKSNLKAAQNEGRDLANRKEVLQNRLSVTTNKKERRSITAQIKDVDTRIANNKGKQSDLNNQLANLKDPNKKATSKSEKSQYKALISASKDQEKYLGDKKNSVQKEFDELVNNGTIKKGSSEWYKWKEELAGIDDEINQCKVDQAEWNEYIANIPINKLKDANDRLQVSADQKQRNISIKEARGGMASADDYNGLIKNSKAQNKNLKEQNKLLEAQRDKYDKGTDKWKEYQEQIDANTEAIDNNIESMINWTNEIVNLPFEKRDKKLEKNQDKRDVYDSNYSVAEDSKSKNKILNKQDSLAKSDLKIYQDTKKEADANVKKYTKNAQKYGVFDTEANKGKKAGQKLSVAGLEKGSDAYNAVVAYNKALEAQKDAEKDVKIATDEATKTLQENAKSRFDNVVADYEGDLNVSSSEQGLTQSKMDYRTASGKVSKYNTSLLTDTLTEQNESLDIQREQLAKAKEAYKKNKNSMSEEDRKAAEASLLDMEAKINDTKTAIIETQNAIDNIPLEKKQDALEKLETQAEKLEDAMSLSDVRGIDATANDYKNLINNSDEQVTNLQDQNAELRKQQEGLSKTSENYLELQKQIDENDAAIRKAEISQEEWNNAIIALPIDKLEKELDLLDSIAALNKSRVDLKSAEGKDLSESDYLQQIQDNSDQVANWQDKSHEYYLNMLQAQKSADGVYGGKTAEEWQQEMNNANTQANNLLATNEQLKDSLRDDVYWRDFERAHEAVQRTKSEIEGIAGLISDDMIYDSDGKLTDFGISKVATLVEQYELASEEVQNYQDDLKNLDDLYASGEYTEEEYKAKLAELKDGLLDSAAAMKDYTDTIVDMYKQMGQAELDALFELIDVRSQALDAKKSYYDFDKTIRGKNKDIESLKARKAALEGIDTAQARAELAQLNADLQDAEDDLNDTMFEHQIEMSQEALDGMKDAMQDAFDDKWETVHSDLGEISKLMKAANDLTIGSSRDINENLKRLLENYGVDPVTSHLDTVGSFASGTRRVGASGYARTQEDGGEIVLKDGSVLLPVEPNDSIIPAKLTDNILAMAKDYPFLQNPKLMQPNLYMTAEAAGANVSVSFNNLINVESGGVIDKYVVDDVSSLTKALVKDKSFMNATYQYTTKEIVRDAKKAGISAR